MSGNVPRVVVVVTHLPNGRTVGINPTLPAKYAHVLYSTRASSKSNCFVSSLLLLLFVCLPSC